MTRADGLWVGPDWKVDRVTLDEFFDGYEQSRQLFSAVCGVVESLGPVELRITKSQIAFANGSAFAWAWVPDRYLGSGHAPLVLSVALPFRDVSERWKEVVEPSPGRFMHHLELWALSDLNDDVRTWLRQARTSAEKPGGDGAAG